MSKEEEATKRPPGSVGPICPYCGCSEFFARKAFPQPLGVMLVVVTAAVFLVLASNPSTFSLALWMLAGITVFDYVLYMLIGKVATCYRCHADQPDRSIVPECRPFDLATLEKYRQEAGRDEKRGRE